MHVEMSNFVRSNLETAFLEDEKSTTLKLYHQAVLTAEIIRRLREVHAEVSKSLFK